MMPAVSKTRYRQTCAAGFLLTDTGYSPGFTRATHVHDLAEFCFVLDGRLLETVGPSSLPALRFDMTFKPAGVAHRSEASGNGARCLVIEVPTSRLKPDEALARRLDAPVFFGNGVLAPLGLRVYRELRSGDELSPLVIEGTALELLAEASRAPRIATVRSPPWMEKVRELLHDCFTQALSQADIARAVGVHPVHLAQVFRREHDCTIGQYIRQLRVNCVRQQLAVTDRPLAEIALASGFCDQGHMTRTFKRLTGTTPGNYRRHPTAA